MTTVLPPLLRTDDPLHFEQTYRRDRVSAPLARHDLRSWLLQRVGLPMRSMAAAEPVVAELTANAIVHGAGMHIHLDARLRPGLLRVAVQDSSREVPFLVCAGQGPHESGHGLLVVTAVCDRWGVELSLPAGKWVWAQLHLPTGSLGAEDRRRQSA